MPASAHPMANPGYGKRSTPDRSPSRSDRFDHLSPRERYVAAFIDRLPDGAAMDAKTLAKALPLYGQQAVRTALNALSRVGHLRRVRRRAESRGVTGDGGEGVTRWVFRTHWSATARDSDWWARFLVDDVPAEEQPETSAEARPASVSPGAPSDVRPQTAQHAEQAEPPHPAERPGPSAAYRALAQLGHAEPRLPLSAADCAVLEELASAWLARGATVDHLTQSLVAGLPEHVHSPRALVQRRLRDKMPPDLPAPEERRPRAGLECTDCGVPGRPEALPDGLCRACRGVGAQAGARPGDRATGFAALPSGSGAGRPDPGFHPLSARDVHRYAAQVRNAMRSQQGTIGNGLRDLLDGRPVTAAR
ncbi:hypothetical protein [Streptomyces sp. NPDC005251]|uniref:hypothetical protein n=1 Tax=unclassified Streptomyces TaxID=2593676 RepID=UPI0033A62D35